MKKACVIALMVCFSQPAWANKIQSDVFASYHYCVSKIENPIVATFLRLKDGIYHRNILNVWAEAFLPVEQVKHAFEALESNDFGPSEKVLRSLELSLNNSQYSRLINFIDQNLAKSNDRNCRQLTPKIAQQLQRVIIKATRVKFEMAEALDLVRLKQDIGGQMGSLRSLLRQITELSDDINADIGDYRE